MTLRVKKNKQFPNGILDLRDLDGGETILMDARLGQVIWLKGKATGEQRLFGTMQLRIGEGPYGFGFMAAPSAGDAPLSVQTPDFLDSLAAGASVNELTEEGAAGVYNRAKGRKKPPWTGPHEWAPW